MNRNLLQESARKEGPKYLNIFLPLSKKLIFFFHLPCSMKFLCEFIGDSWGFVGTTSVIRTDCFFLLGINFCGFQKVPNKIR